MSSFWASPPTTSRSRRQLNKRFSNGLALYDRIHLGQGGWDYIQGDDGGLLFWIN